MIQYQRLFNTARRSISTERDEIKHWPTKLRKSGHVIVIHKGRYFKIDVYRNNHLLTPAEFQDQISQILNDNSVSQPGEQMLASLTAGSRDKWQAARQEHFSDRVNYRSLLEIEMAAFVVVLDEEKYDNTLSDQNRDLSRMGKSFLHGKVNDRWFDKSFNLVVTACGNMGLNGEHSFADAPVVALLLEKFLLYEHLTGYDANGDARGERFSDQNFLYPKRLRFQLTKQAIDDIQISYNEAKILADDLDLFVLPFSDFDKNVITKKFKSSPDAFIQAALQLAHLYDKNKHVLTYESAMTRFYLHGRTETVRSCTKENVEFCRLTKEFKSGGNVSLAAEITKSELREAYYAHERNHVLMNRKAMVGEGIDRHLFALYVMAYATNINSEFLKEAFAMKWELTTSQTPPYQTKEILPLTDLILSPGGGFGPATLHGYGCSYILMGKDLITFHVSSYKSSDETSSERFAFNIKRAMNDIAEILRIVSEED